LKRGFCVAVVAPINRFKSFTAQPSALLACLKAHFNCLVQQKDPFSFVQKNVQSTNPQNFGEEHILDLLGRHFIL